MKTLKLRTVQVFTGLALILTAACHDDNGVPNDPDYVVFGDFYGECIGSGCVDIYKLQTDAIYEDNKDVYPSMRASYNGNYILRTNVNIDDIKDLLDKIPAQLYGEQDTVLGAPDAADGGGFYIEVNRNHERRFWLIDKQKFDGDRAYLNAFTDIVQEKLDLLEKDSDF